MRGKRYRTRRHWHNVAVWTTASAIFLGIGVLFTAATGKFIPLLALLILAMLGLVISVARDRAIRCYYVVDGDILWLHSQSSVYEVRISDVQDASLVERAAARDYIQQKLRKAKEDGLDMELARQRERDYIKYCSVDIGLRSFSFGIGRRMIDRMPDARRDLVLLRLRNGQDHLLSPVYNQDLVSALSRVIHTSKRA